MAMPDTPFRKETSVFEPCRIKEDRRAYLELLRRKFHSEILGTSTIYPILAVFLCKEFLDEFAL
jgi:hypothetical protein